MADRATETQSLGRLMDLMRIVAALLIFYYHAGLLLHLPLSRFGDHAVSTFIVLAIVASMALGKSAEQGSAASYLWRRIKRLFPMFFLINVAIFAASHLYPSRLGRPYSFWQLLLSAFGLSQYVGQPYLSEVFWFIPFILQVYVIIAFFGRRLLELNWKFLFAVGALVSAVAIWRLSNVMNDNLFEMRKWSPLLRLPEVGFGLMTAAFIGRVLQFHRYCWNLLFYGVITALLACGSFLVPRAAYLFCYPLTGLVVTLIVAGTAAGVLFVTEPLGVSSEALRFLGRATFPFFLIHGVGMRFVNSRYDGRILPWCAYFSACVVAAIVLEFAFRFRVSAKASATLAGK